MTRFKAFPFLASVDIGSYSCILLLAKKEDGIVKPIAQKIEVCRLGENIDLEKLCEILSGFRSFAHSLGAEIKVAVMTEAIRKTSNQEEIIEAVEKVLWIKPKIISGEEEARLSYLAISKVYGQDIVCIDVGGGSTELSQGKHFLSIPVGALSLSKEMGTIPGPEYKAWSKTFFKEINLKPFAKKSAIFVGGTAVALGMLAKEMQKFDAQMLEGQTVHLTDIERVIIQISNLSKELRNSLPGLEQNRGDIIICGLYWIRSLCEKLKIDSIRISTQGLRFGLLYEQPD